MHGRKILEKVDKSMNFFNQEFDVNKHIVLEIIKQIPPSIKVFHIICNYAKTEKDSSLAEKVPKVLSIIESLNHQVKELFEKNNCTVQISLFFRFLVCKMFVFLISFLFFFFLGALEARDIHGTIQAEEIPSTAEAASDDSENEDSEKEDDNDDDMEE